MWKGKDCGSHLIAVGRSIHKEKTLYAVRAKEETISEIQERRQMKTKTICKTGGRLIVIGCESWSRCLLVQRLGAQKRIKIVVRSDCAPSMGEGCLPWERISFHGEGLHSMREGCFLWKQRYQ